MPKFKLAENDGLIENFIEASMKTIAEYQNEVPKLADEADRDANRVKKKMGKWLLARDGTIVDERLPGVYQICNDCNLEEILAKGIPWDKEVSIPVRSNRKKGIPKGPEDLESVKPSQALLNELKYLVQRANIVQKVAVQVYNLLICIEPKPKEGMDPPIVLLTLKAIFLDCRQAVRPMQNILSDYLQSRATREEEYYKNFMASETFNSILAFDHIVWHRLFRCHRAFKQIVIYIQTLIEKYIEHIQKFAIEREQSAESMYIT